MAIGGPCKLHTLEAASLQRVRYNRCPCDGQRARMNRSGLLQSRAPDGGR